METTLTLQLLHQEIVMPDLTIGQAMDIAHIPQEYNEKRLSSLIGHISDDITLAGKLTAQERYYFLLNHQSISDHDHAQSRSNDSYYIPTIPLEVPENNEIAGLFAQHLRGAHTCIIEGLCENVFEWLCAQMACQLYGDLTAAIGASDSDLQWDVCDISLGETRISQMIQERVEQIKKLSATNTNQFDDLVNAYSQAIQPLAHFVDLGCDNTGLTVMKQGGDGDNMPARFLTLDHLQGAAARIAECLAERRDGDGGTR